jgi:hypothetical protein
MRQTRQERLGQRSAGGEGEVILISAGHRTI